MSASFFGSVEVAQPVPSASPLRPGDSSPMPTRSRPAFQMRLNSVAEARRSDLSMATVAALVIFGAGSGSGAATSSSMRMLIDGFTIGATLNAGALKALHQHNNKNA